MDAIEESEMKALIAKGNKDGFTLLMRAAANDRPEAVAVLPSKGADICARDQRGNTALMYACMRGNLSVVKVLLRAGANAGAENLYGHCVLLTAWNCGHWDVVKCLLGHGDGINVSLGTHLTGCMLLWNAILDNRADQIITLLRAGTDSMVKDTHGFTVFDLVKDNEKCNHWLPHVQVRHAQILSCPLESCV
jgi:ankyrin repeat protein